MFDSALPSRDSVVLIWFSHTEITLLEGQILVLVLLNCRLNHVPHGLVLVIFSLPYWVSKLSVY